MIRGKARLPLRGSYDFVFGLGQNCANAAYMAQWNLRTCSSPFDWLDGSKAGLANCVDLICNDFGGFLEKDALQPIENRMGELDDRNCDYYFDPKSGYRSSHDFPRGVPLEVSHPVVMAKFNRRIRRMYRRVAEARHTLFVYWARFESLSDDRLRELAGRLRGKFPGRDVDLLVIEHEEDAEGIRSVVSVLPGVVHVRGRFFIELPNHSVMGDQRLNGLVYSAIPRSPGLWLMGLRLNAVRMAVRFCSSFCPGRERRRELRKIWLERLVGKELV